VKGCAQTFSAANAAKMHAKLPHDSSGKLMRAKRGRAGVDEDVGTHTVVDEDDDVDPAAFRA
jgi:hypothetical protein